MKRILLLLALPLVLAGCFRPSPGGLQGAWVSREDFDTPQVSITETVEYIFDGNEATRVLIQDIRLKATGESVALITESTGTYTVDESVSPAQMSISGIQRNEYPTNVQFAVAGAILGNSAADQELFFGESAGITLQQKALFRRDGRRLLIKFGSDTLFPASLDPPLLIEAEKAFRLFP